MNTQTSPWTLNHLDLQLIDLALTEDLGMDYHDITTSLLFSDKNSPSQAKIISKHPETIIMCGLPIVRSLIAKFGNTCEIRTEYQDGQMLKPGTTLLTLNGPPNILLMIERTLLNFLQHLCAIATYTAKFVKLIQHTHTKVLDTRKTLPGFRHLDKYAVFCGGGVNHRMGLYDAIMIKDTHIDSLGGMSIALRALPNDIHQKYPVLVEVRTLSELKIVLNEAQHKVTRVLLDNMSKDEMSQCVTLCQNALQTEASGNINLTNIVTVAECGVDFISIGKLTHSAGNVDLSMKCEI